jgi:fructosamine-3-kinase
VSATGDRSKPGTGDGRRRFIKQVPREHAAMLAAEADGLDALRASEAVRVPALLAHRRHAPSQRVARRLGGLLARCAPRAAARARPLNHLNLFGTGYLDRVERCLARLLAQAR